MPVQFVLLSNLTFCGNKLLWAFITLLIVVNLISVSESADAYPVVVTPLGPVRGHSMETRGKRTISAFTSIPYASPPVGELRFKAPVPVTKWSNTLDATKSSPACVQRNPYVRQPEIVGQEDCLYLNIYTPYTNEELAGVHKPLPVMVFVHGGGWMCGDSSTKMYGPEYLLDRDVLLVGINYRLGPLGFLSTQDAHCPGNNGLKDQQEALRFIQKVISSFGGDKDSVTIFGESAGGASSHFHMLSKTSRGLFHKAISESGVATVPWAEAPPGEALRQAFRLAKFLDCPQTPTEVMLACLRAKDSYDIINTEFQFYTWDYEPMTPFKAVVEPDLPGAFLTVAARDSQDVASIPWMTGLNSAEGCLKSVWITANQTRLKEFKTGFETIAPVTFYYDSSPFVDLVNKKVKEHYLDGGDEDKYNQGLLDIYSDSYFAYPAVEAVDQFMRTTGSPVYLYELAYRANNSFSQIFGDPIGDYGVCHADELMHLFPMFFLENKFSDEDIEMSKLIVTLWTNFATTGNPNKPVKIPFKWSEVSSSKSMEYLEINKEPNMKKNLAVRSRFWGTLPLWHRLQKSRFMDELNYTTRVPSRAEWTEGLEPPRSGVKDSIWYTDGSKMGSGTGAGIYANDYCSSVSMGSLATVFQAETYAIIACAQEYIDRQTRGQTIYILGDSRAALKALTAPKVASRLVYNGVQALNKLGKHNKGQLVWIPGHEGFIGNERADELARGGSTICGTLTENHNLGL